MGRHLACGNVRLIPAHAGKTGAGGDSRGDVEAHPRSRGENIESRTVTAPCAGSSPLTRGKHQLGAYRSLYPGLIPAHAGKTHRSRRTWRSSGAHPRSRGENPQSTAPADRPSGSSPLTRGKLARVTTLRGLARLIPAHAGKTRSCSSSLPARGAHPRSRGENAWAAEEDVSGTGSSPLTRGKLSSARRQSRLTGLIPAHAGKTARWPAPSARPRAHPRSRGENPYL